MRKSVNHIDWLVALIFVLLTGGCGNAGPSVHDPEDFYRGNVLRIVVGVNPGGGFDEYARMVAVELAKRTGGKVVVENQPGGGTLLALNRIIEAPPDGLSLMLVGGEAIMLGKLTERPGIRFEIRDLAWLGRVQKDTPVVLWSPVNPERDFNSVLRHIYAGGSVWGASGLTDNISDAESILGQALNLAPEQMNIVIGYSGSSEVALAAIRGEVDGMIVSSTSAMNYVSSDAQQGLVPIAILDRERDGFFPDVPTIFEVEHLQPQQAWWVDFRAKVTAIGRSFVTRHDVPEERLVYLRKKLAEVLTDEKFIADGAARNKPINFLDAEEQARLVKSILDEFSAARQQELKHVLTEKYIE